MEDTQKEAVVDEQVDEKQDDTGNFDLTEELVAFNKGEVDESPESEESGVDMAESDNEEVAEITEEVSQESVEQWLIDSKFKDDDEGKHKLADSYRNLQSEYDKLKNAPPVTDDAKEAIEFATWVANNEEAREALNTIANKTVDNPVEVPEDFDQLEMYTPGTTSNDWWIAVQSKERERIRSEVVADVRGEFEKRDNVVKEETEAKAMYKHLADDQGLSATEIDEYMDFIGKEESYKTDNLVKLFKMSKGDTTQPKPKTKRSESQAPQPKVVPPVTGAAVFGGGNPPATPTEAVDQLMESLMGNSKRDVFSD